MFYLFLFENDFYHPIFNSKKKKNNFKKKFKNSVLGN